MKQLTGVKERKKSPTHSPHRYYHSVSQRDDELLEDDQGGSDRSPLLPSSSNGVTAVVVGQSSVMSTDRVDGNDDDGDENCDIRETVEMVSQLSSVKISFNH